MTNGEHQGEPFAKVQDITDEATAAAEREENKARFHRARVDRARARLAEAPSLMTPGRLAILEALVEADDDGAALERVERATVALRARVKGPAPSFRERVQGAINIMTRRADGEERPIATPWESVNRALRGGFWPGLYTLTSATGIGKTQWAMACALAAARAFKAEHAELVTECERQDFKPPKQEPNRVAYIALELGDVDLVARCLGLMAAEAGVTSEELGTRYPLKWSDLFFGRVPRALAAVSERFGPELAALPMHLETADAIGFSYVDIQRIAEEQKPRLIILDYSQLCGAPEGRREELRETIGRVARVSRDIARKYGSAVLALSSTARANYAAVDGAIEEQKGKPKTAPLGQGDPARLVGLGKESGELEFTADVVLALAREPRDGDEPKEGAERPTWLAIAKGRGFPTGWVKLAFDGSRFDEYKSQPDHGASAVPQMDNPWAKNKKTKGERKTKGDSPRTHASATAEQEGAEEQGEHEQ